MAILKYLADHNGTILELGRDLVTTLVLIVAGIILNRLIQRLMKKAASARNLVPGAPPIDETVTSVLALVVRYGIFIIVVIMILTAFGVNTASLIAVLGAAGVAIGLALKDILGNIAAGIIILFQGSYRRGEYIEFGSYSGTVRDINLFTTILETPDGVHISAPNSSVWGVPLKNYSRNGRRRMDLSVSIAYTDSLDTAFRVMGDIAASETRFQKDPAPQILVQSLGDSAVTIVLRAWASGDEYWSIYWDQMRNLKDRIEAAGLHIPFPQRDLHVKIAGLTT
ncbi:MAG: mechanosensitive ion channel [Treponema sp.]|jgi:small conductance mechanosensitive channel|nr:mechanosensitive ion channel [Treponema sp.]